MILLGLDDTDMPGTPGTNQLARAVVRRLEGRCRLVRIVRHQLLDDPRVPYTSKNGSASILLEEGPGVGRDEVVSLARAEMRDRFTPGSDPGLCAAARVPDAVMVFGRRCQREVVTQAEARAVAAAAELHLEGLGGTEGGVIGALAAVGLGVGGDDGRVVHLGSWPDDLSGPQPVEVLAARGVRVVREADGGEVTAGAVDVGKRLRPNCRGGRVVLFVVAAPGGNPAGWVALKRP